MGILDSDPMQVSHYADWAEGPHDVRDEAEAINGVEDSFLRLADLVLGDNGAVMARLADLADHQLPTPDEVEEMLGLHTPLPRHFPDLAKPTDTDPLIPDIERTLSISSTLIERILSKQLAAEQAGEAAIMAAGVQSSDQLQPRLAS